VDRPEVITKQELQNPPAEQSASMQRGQAFAHDGIWAGFAVFPGGASTSWHHHGDYATYAYITSGGLTVEFGPGGTELVVSCCDALLRQVPARSNRALRRRAAAAPRRISPLDIFGLNAI
jgi:uncharacterized RmlC-like cupin family protein